MNFIIIVLTAMKSPHVLRIGGNKGGELVCQDESASSTVQLCNFTVCSNKLKHEAPTRVVRACYKPPLPRQPVRNCRSMSQTIRRYMRDGFIILQNPGKQQKFQCFPVIFFFSRMLTLKCKPLLPALWFPSSDINETKLISLFLLLLLDWHAHHKLKKQTKKHPGCEQSKSWAGYVCDFLLALLSQQGTWCKSDFERTPLFIILQKPSVDTR